MNGGIPFFMNSLYLIFILFYGLFCTSCLLKSTILYWLVYEPQFSVLVNFVEIKYFHNKQEISRINIRY